MTLDALFNWLAKPNPTDWLLVIFNGLLVLFSLLLYRVNKRLTWITGAMESHSDLTSKMLAKREGIPVIWWDPTVQEWPRQPKHGDQYQGKVMLTYLPPKLRGHPDNKPIDVDALLRGFESKRPRRRSQSHKRTR